MPRAIDETKLHRNLKMLERLGSAQARGSIAPRVHAFGEAERVVYQRQRTRAGVITRRLKYYRPTDRKTPKQLERRAVFRDAVEWWAEMPEPTRQIWEDKGARKQIPGRNAFIADYLQTH